MEIVVTGISGKLGRQVASLLAAEGHRVLGIDRRPWPDAPEGVEMFAADVRKRPAEDVFRTEHPDAVVHMATVTHLVPSEKRYRINLHGTRKVFDYCHRYGVGRVVFVGRHTFYGAAPDAHLYYTEDDPPLAMSTFPELADMVGADLFAGSALWRHPEMDTVVLRMCYTLGPSHHGVLARYLRGPRVPTVLGFDPLYQFMHEHDAARAIATALSSEVRGVYNVAGPQPVPLSLLVEVTRRSNIRIPEPLYNMALGRFGLPYLPPGAINHIKYPVVVDDHLFREATGFEHTYDEAQTMESFRWAP
jgi:UDP-glucose 4-epimerase